MSTLENYSFEHSEWSIDRRRNFEFCKASGSIDVDVILLANQLLQQFSQNDFTKTANLKKCRSKCMGLLIFPKRWQEWE
jgi:hypothetical protein